MQQTKPTQKQEQILEVLVDECQRNPKTSLAGLNIRLLGYKVGAYLGIGVIYDVAKLKEFGLVSRYGKNVIITQKGLSYTKAHKLGFNPKRLDSPLLIAIIISVIAGLIVAIITGWWPW